MLVMKKHLRKILAIPAVLLLGAALTATQARAASVTYGASEGDLSAEVTFDFDGTNLEVTLTNISLADVLVPTDVLTGVFFNLAGDPELTRVSGVLGAGSTVIFDDPPAGGVVGGEWTYETGLGGLAPLGANQGLSSTGTDWSFFGSEDLFPGDNLQGPEGPDGLQYGITSAGDDTSTGNTPVTGTNALIKNSVVLTLGGLPGGFTLADISGENISFLYGTSMKTVPIPEPVSLVLLGVGLLATRKAVIKIRKDSRS